MLLKVRLFNDPILRKKCEEVKVDALEEYSELLADMHETMLAESGAGLAANQVGYSIQLFILKKDSDYQEYFNPKIVSTSEPTRFDGEACLSIPGTSGITTRFKNITLEWLDRHGNPFRGSFENFDAFAVQHEMDHLNGILYIDQFSSLKRDMVLSKHKKFMRQRRT